LRSLTALPFGFWRTTDIPTSMYVGFHGVKRRIIIRVFVDICRKTLGFGRFSRQPTHPTALHQFDIHVCPLNVLVASFPI
jgi:hypothetical protein